MPKTIEEIQAKTAVDIARSARRLETVARATGLAELAYYAGMLRIEAEDRAQAEDRIQEGNDADRESEGP